MEDQKIEDGQTIEEVEALIKDAEAWQEAFLMHPFYDPDDEKDEGTQVPMICVWSDGRQYLGGFLGRLPSEAIILAHPLMVHEHVQSVQNRYEVRVAMNPPSFTFGLIDEMEVNSGAVYWLLKDRPKDASLLLQYEEAYNQLKAEEAGIAVPTSKIVV